MTFRSFSFARALFSLALVAAPAMSCGGSTDTGNPPVVIGQKLRLTASSNGVTVAGEPGAVPAGARIEVVNTSTGEVVTTTAQADGSFSIELDGSVTDAYRVYTEVGTESWRMELTSSGAGQPEVGLEGLELLLDSAQGFTPVEGTTVRLSFEDGELGFSAGCNSHSGPYSVCDGKICVSSLAGTEIGCDPPRHAQDEWLAAFFTASPSFQQLGARVTLEGSGATLEFIDREVKDPDRPLVGPTWTIDTLISGGAASNTPLDEPPTAVFGADGNIAVFAGCNNGQGSYTVAGQTISLSEFAYTEEGCNDAGARAVEEHIQRVLTDGDVSFEIDAARLDITRGDIGISATTE